MKLTIYSLTTEFENCGIETQVFGSVAGRDNALATIMTERFESGYDHWNHSELIRVEEAKAKIEAGDVLGAWEIFRQDDDTVNPLHGSDDGFWVEAHEVEIPVVNALVEAAFAVERATVRKGEAVSEVPVENLLALKRAAADVAVPE